MYKVNKIGMVESCITRKPTDLGESIEEMVRRCTESKEPIENVAPMVYTEEAAGVQPQYDIRTDRMDIALDAIDKYQKSEIAREKAAQTEKNKVEENAQNQPNEPN